MRTFDNAEDEYLQWVAAHPGGYVINAPKRRGDYADMLHRASCGSITTRRQSNYTTTTFKKLCSLDKRELVTWAERNSDDFRSCKLCKP